MSTHCNHCHGHNHTHNHEHGHTHSHGHSHSGPSGFKGVLHSYSSEIISGTLLIVSIILRSTGVFASWCGDSGFDWISLTAFLIAIIPVGWPVIREMAESWAHGSFMNEFTLMVAASVGAFFIGEYPEAVAVLLFYSLGEKLEDSASDDVKRRIRSLLGRIPDRATVLENGKRHSVRPQEVAVGSHILVQPGERVPLDAILSGKESADFDTAAITGESVPRSFAPGSELPSGIIPVDRAVEATVIRPYNDSSMTRILKMIEDAQAGKSHTETMLRRITRWYTPVVFILALAIFFIPWAVTAAHGNAFDWQMWLRRSLVFLVCSCPCALVVSIPLSYFVSLGSASRIGLLFKGSKYLDACRKLRNVVFDKTGTLTTGQFSVTDMECDGDGTLFPLAYAAAVDTDSSHPLAKAIVRHAAETAVPLPVVTGIHTVAHGMEADSPHGKVLVGSAGLLRNQGIDVLDSRKEGSRICVALDNRYIGSLYLSDTVKPEAAKTIAELHKMGIKVTILSGDREPAVQSVANAVGADGWNSELLPEEKQRIVARMHTDVPTAFVGDGINDAPAIAASDVGVAMGTMGTGMAMDTADVIISGDNLSKITSAIRLSRRVQATVIQNVSFALGIKALVMILGALGIATLWAAVFADTGVTLITILWTLLRVRIGSKK